MQYRYVLWNLRQRSPQMQGPVVALMDSHVLGTLGDEVGTCDYAHASLTSLL